MKYVNTQITFREVPNLVTRCFSISNCGGDCPFCHSPELREDIGDELTNDILLSYFRQDRGTVDCYVFLGDGQDLIRMSDILKLCKENNYKTCLYLGKNTIPLGYLRYLDYIKLGPYIKSLGSLESKTTNQRMFEVKDITSQFWKS